MADKSLVALLKAEILCLEALGLPWIFSELVKHSFHKSPWFVFWEQKRLIHNYLDFYYVGIYVSLYTGGILRPFQQTKDVCRHFFFSKTSAQGFKPWWMESCTHNSKQQKLVCSDPKKLVSSESIDWNACLCSVFCQVETSCLLVFRFLSSWNIMLACVPVSVKWGHLRNIVCYFFCNALIVTTVVYSSGLLSLYNYDLLKPPFVFNCRRFNEDSDDDSAPDTSSNC